MFDYSKMIQRAVQFFPTWSDIRKRYKTSTGGKLIGSILEETCELEDAIKEYKKYASETSWKLYDGLKKNKDAAYYVTEAIKSEKYDSIILNLIFLIFL